MANSASFSHLEKGDPSHPKVLLLHGLMGSARNLYKLVQAVADAGFHALAYDQRGHGHSPHGGNYSLEGLADDVFTFLDQRGIESTQIVGHSMGARVALCACARGTGRLTSLTMLDAGARPTDEGRDDVKQTVFALEESYSSKQDAELKLAKFPDRTKQFLIANLRERDGRLTWLFDLKAIREQLFPSLKDDQIAGWRSLSIPALVVRGDRSEYLPEAEMQRMKTARPAAQTAVIKNAGHWLHVDNFVDTSKTVVEFIGSNR